jgi:Ser/Thr protein kinase RdoA (MazF antagonist)
MQHDLEEIARSFALGGEIEALAPYGSGHINDTFVSTVRTPAGTRRFAHQRINHNVFKKPEQVMENIERVTVHLRGKIVAAGGNPDRETLNLVPANDGRTFHRDAKGNYWRTYFFIEGARTYDVAQDPGHLYRASKAFGRFQKMLSDLPAPRLHETIPGFHDTRRRYQQFTEAVAADPLGRAGEVREEIDFITARKDQAPVLIELLERGEAPERIVHNDTKFNNVMIDDATGEAVCVVDLDTVMPGLVMYDFGDSVRTGACSAEEDEVDLSKVEMQLDKFDRLAAGYLEEAGEFLLPVEIDRLAFSARLITLEQAIRFLADHVAGDVYYKTHRPGHNLDRARTQIRLVRDMEAKADRMEDIVHEYRR